MGMDPYTTGSGTKNGPVTHPPGWTLGPILRFWPRQGHLATLWILENLVYYIVHNRRTMSLEEYIDFLRRAR